MVWHYGACLYASQSTPLPPPIWLSHSKSTTKRCGRRPSQLFDQSNMLLFLWRRLRFDVASNQTRPIFGIHHIFFSCRSHMHACPLVLSHPLTPTRLPRLIPCAHTHATRACPRDPAARPLTLRMRHALQPRPLARLLLLYLFLVCLPDHR